MVERSLFVLVSCLLLYTISADVELQTRQGTIYGRQTQHSNEFLGIQYARTERWKPPVDLASGRFPNGSLQANLFGPCCPQANAGIFIPSQDEQCLYLNIYTPLSITNNSLLPVLVWIHGGGLQVGCSSQNIPVLYNGSNIIANVPEKQPVIVVTINYRLSIFGDLYLKDLVEEDPQGWPTAGNYFYLDMLSALRWVNVNIRDYGGNPENVLLFGESSGANAVIDIGALKGSANLYQHVISQSGGAGFFGYYTNTSDALIESNKIIQKVNCTNQRSLLQCLRNLSTADLVASYGFQQTKVVVDKYFLEYYPPVAIHKGIYNPNISMIIGRNEYESPMCFTYPDMNLTSVKEMLIQASGEKWAEVFIQDPEFKNCSPDRNATNRCCEAARSFFTHFILDCSARRIHDALFRHNFQENLFLYHIDCNPGLCPVKSEAEGKGLCFHASELPFVFGTVSDMYSNELMNCTWDVETRVFSNRIISHWISTATVGKPLSDWLNYSPSTPRYYQITPFHPFSTLTTDRNCSLIDQFEEEKIEVMFGNSKNKSFRNYANRSFIVLLILFFAIF
ncbi:unnamed protein product [Adineta ricciae]|uniref:Carboxylesterase type B domain-containing protein n=1 Tax=Adineta ricciae TaxID=249248 RepID=A0A815EN82_ADIRI|nr:unnamed protein product [Adineta ricciae]CAF1375744.1 unnamed protein product [Adineta ricciae]